MNISEESLRKHGEWHGKIEVISRVPVTNTQELSLAYTPGVSAPCLAIQKDPSLSYQLTRRSNLVAVITDGTAVLGLGDIGPEAGMPVMEGKCSMFKSFADVDAFPLCIRSKDVDELVRTIYLISGSFGGINLEDISAPRCFEVERRLQELCDIPVFHDDQHGAAIVVGAAVHNAMRLTGRKIEDIRVVVNGAGAAGCSIGTHLMKMGARDITMVDRFGILCEGMEGMNPAHEAISRVTNRRHLRGSLADALVGADLFVGVSAPNIVSQDMIRSMAKDPLVFPLANPVPEIQPDLAKEAGARVVGTGRSDYANQINNVLVFPGIFRGALDVRASRINDEMQMAASFAIASLVADDELTETYILPKAFDPRVGETVAKAVSQAARDSGVARI